MTARSHGPTDPQTRRIVYSNGGPESEDAAGRLGLERRIEQKLCELGNLVTGQFPLTRRQVVRGGAAVADYFCLHGPRSVKLTAILDHRRNEILFYGSDGIRKEAVADG